MRFAGADLVQYLDDRRDHYLGLRDLDSVGGIRQKLVASSRRQGSVGVMRWNPRILKILRNLFAQLRKLRGCAGICATAYSCGSKRTQARGRSFCIGGSNNGLRFIDALRPSVDTSTVNSA